MPHRQHIYLVPGFFGFVNLGERVYFAHVRELLAAACRQLGAEVVVHPVQTLPTAAIPKRAVLLAQAVARTAGDGDGGIHLVGHSAGGLDARLLVSPGVILPAGVEVERLAARVRSVTMVSTPHHGTPLAGFFTTRSGRQTLDVLSLVTAYVLRFGNLPLAVLLRAAAMLTRLDDRIGLRDTVADQIFELLLANFPSDRRREVRAFLEQTGRDLSLLAQLTPKATEWFNAVTRDRPGVRYGCVVGTARPQGPAAFLRIGVEPYAQVTHLLFLSLHRMASQVDETSRPQPDARQTEALLRGFGRVPDAVENDGIVPTLSQLWGEVLHCCWADHLDVVGHFQDGERRPPHHDWLASGTGFDRDAFEQLWNAVARHIVASAG